MLETQLAGLLDAQPAGVTEALDVIDGFDAVLVTGLGRLGQGSGAALAALAAAVGGTPLGPVVGDAVSKTVSGSVHDEQLAALAGARAAVFGAVHDALVDQCDAALGRDRTVWEHVTSGAAEPDNLLAGVRSWLRDVAIAGWLGVDDDLITGCDQVVRALLAVPRRRRLAMLLDGLASELRASAPVAKMPSVPARRWADLWTRALLLTHSGGANPAGASDGDSVGASDGGEPETVSGRLFVLGVDVHEHNNAVQVQVHGILETRRTAARLVRTNVASGKVETIVGPAVWRLLSDHAVLMRALAERRSIELKNVPLLRSGDLLWHDDRATLGEPADPFALARVQLGGAVAFATPPLDRHPVQISQPVLIEGYTVSGAELSLGAQRLPVTMDRLPACGPLTADLVAGSSACIGLLRFDHGGWRLQPLGVQTTVKRKPAAIHTGDWAMGPTDPKVAKASGDAVGVLRERAGRLLRR